MTHVKICLQEKPCNGQFVYVVGFPKVLGFVSIFCAWHFAYMYVYTMSVPTAPGGQKWASDPMQL